MQSRLGGLNLRFRGDHLRILVCKLLSQRRKFGLQQCELLAERRCGRILANKRGGCHRGRLLAQRVLSLPEARINSLTLGCSSAALCLKLGQLPNDERRLF